MPFRKATKRLIPVLRNCLLVICLLYIGGSWVLSPGTPDLDEVVLKHALGNGMSIYGARDGQGVWRYRLQGIGLAAPAQ